MLLFIETVVDRRPARVAIDPYYKLIDRDRGDNVRAVLSAGTQTGRADQGRSSERRGPSALPAGEAVSLR